MAKDEIAVSNLTEVEMRKLQLVFQEMKKTASEDPVYFIDTFCYTFNPKVEKGESPHLRFRLFPFQKRLVRDLYKHIQDGEDLFIEKCREMGVTYTILATLLWFWLFVPGSNFLVGSRKEDYVDNRRGGTTGNKEESLFGKIDYMLSRLPAFMLPEGFNREKHFNFMSLVNPENGNVISGESANPNFSRGSRHKAIFLDEFAFWQFGNEVWGATADTTRCRIIATTPGDAPSKAKRIRFGKDGEKIRVITLSYDLDPRKTKKWLENERARRSPEDFAREILINWEGSTSGRVYPEIDTAVLGDFPYIPNVTLYCAWDFGLDGTALVFAQQNPQNGKIRIIDTFQGENNPIQWYFPLFGQPVDSKFIYTDSDLSAIREISQLPKAIHFGDPDVRKRSYVSANSSAKTELQKIGIYVQSITKNDFYTRRDKTKIYLARGLEINQNGRTEYFLEAIKSARYPQRDETSQSTQPISLPVHDWSSHYRTALEYLFLNVDQYLQPPSQTPSWAMAKKGGWLTGRNKLLASYRSE